MPISEKDAKILWGRAGGRCSNPACDIDLTRQSEQEGKYHFGEMAHVIASSPVGPRNAGAKGKDTYDNLILLCPTCHRMIDKAPAEYPKAMLYDWKNIHEKNIREAGRTTTFVNFTDLRKAIKPLLLENKELWEQLGPHSIEAQNNPGSNLFKLWNMKKLSVIIPNNTKIINLIEGNQELIFDDYKIFLKFKTHAQAFESHQYKKLENYPSFPKQFSEIFK